MNDIELIWGDDKNTDEIEGIKRGKNIIDILSNHNINPNSILDLCCGKGYVLSGISEELPDADCCGIDIRSYDEWTKYSNIDEYGRYSMIKFQIDSFQHFINTSEDNFDLVLMLETWRNWTMVAENNLIWRRNLVAWLKDHAKYFICTGSLFELESYPNEIIAKDITSTLYLVTL